MQRPESTPEQTGPAPFAERRNASAGSGRRHRRPRYRVVRRMLERLLAWLFCDGWTPRMGVALAVLAVILMLIVIIGVTLGPVVMLVVLAAMAVMRCLRDGWSCLLRS